MNTKFIVTSILFVASSAAFFALGAYSIEPKQIVKTVEIQKPCPQLPAPPMPPITALPKAPTVQTPQIQGKACSEIPKPIVKYVPKIQVKTVKSPEKTIYKTIYVKAACPKVGNSIINCPICPNIPKPVDTTKDQNFAILRRILK
jgi:hypothetical protein